MYRPAFKVKKSGVPVLSAEEIENIGERFIADFCPDALENPQPIDVDGFLENYLGMIPEYQYLSNNGVYLGMTVFNTTDKVVIYSPETQRAEYMHAEARTVIIDASLLAPDQAHRYRFTAGHEAGHDIFHSGYFSYNPDQLSLFPKVDAPMISCRRDGNNYSSKNYKLWTDHDWMEWQANKFSSVLNMPKKAVQKVAAPYIKSGSIALPVKQGLLIAQISSLFDVSISAAHIRLKELGIIQRENCQTIDYYAAICDFSDILA